MANRGAASLCSDSSHPPLLSLPLASSAGLPQQHSLPSPRTTTPAICTFYSRPQFKPPSFRGCRIPQLREESRSRPASASPIRLLLSRPPLGPPLSLSRPPLAYSFLPPLGRTRASLPRSHKEQHFVSRPPTSPCFSSAPCDLALTATSAIGCHGQGHPQGLAAAHCTLLCCTSHPPTASLRHPYTTFNDSSSSPSRTSPAPRACRQQRSSSPRFGATWRRAMAPLALLRQLCARSGRSRGRSFSRRQVAPRCSSPTSPLRLLQSARCH
jgi:hypothetical protein